MTKTPKLPPEPPVARKNRRRQSALPPLTDKMATPEERQAAIARGQHVLVGRHHPNSTENVKAEMLEMQVFDLKILGHSFMHIATALQRPYTTVRDAWFRALEKRREEDSDKVMNWKATQVARLEKYHSTIANDIANGDPEALKLGILIHDRMARIWGLDAPVKTANTDTAGNTLVPPAPVQAIVNISQKDLDGMNTEQLIALYRDLARRPPPALPMPKESKG